MTPKLIKKIPKFKNREEEANFWDTHSFSDYWDQMKSVKVVFAKNLSEGITVRFDPKTMIKLRKTAQIKGLGPTTLVRMWVMEHLGAQKNYQTA